MSTHTWRDGGLEPGQPWQPLPAPSACDLGYLPGPAAVKFSGTARLVGWWPQALVCLLGLASVSGASDQPAVTGSNMRAGVTRSTWLLALRKMAPSWAGFRGTCGDPEARPQWSSGQWLAKNQEHKRLRGILQGWLESHGWEGSHAGLGSLGPVQSRAGRRRAEWAGEGAVAWDVVAADSPAQCPRHTYPSCGPWNARGQRAGHSPEWSREVEGVVSMRRRGCWVEGLGPLPSLWAGGQDGKGAGAQQCLGTGEICGDLQGTARVPGLSGQWNGPRWLGALGPAVSSLPLTLEWVTVPSEPRFFVWDKGSTCSCGQLVADEWGWEETEAVSGCRGQQMRAFVGVHMCPVPLPLTGVAPAPGQERDWLWICAVSSP